MSDPTPEINGSPIPADHIKFSDDGTTAWLVVPNTDGDDWEHVAFWHGSDRPCSTCVGVPDNKYSPYTCVTCEGSGRHCFKIEVECPHCTDGVCGDDREGSTRWYCQHCWTDDFQKGTGVRKLTVSVVPGMVVEIRPFLMLVGRQIVPDWASTDPNTWLYYPATDERPLATDTPSGLQFTDNCDQIVLPSAAAPNMFAINLKVHNAH